MKELSKYEVLRAEKIAANRLKLESLGLVKSKSFSRPTKKKRKPISPQFALRRSSRRRILSPNEQVNIVKEKEVLERSAAEQMPLPVVLRRKVKAEIADLYRQIPSLEISAAHLHEGPRVSSSLLSLNVDFFHSAWLGRQILPLGKFTIMSGACPGHIPVFSNLSGIQSWKNCIMLFVNLGDESAYSNVFTEITKKNADQKNTIFFNWYAQNRHKEETPIIQRLLVSTKGDECFRLNDSFHEREASNSPDTILLFCRNPKGPYIYCGRLGYLGHSVESKPLLFRWQLLDVHLLCWENIKDIAIKLK